MMWPVALQEATPDFTINGVILSQASRSSSGCRNMSSMIPLVPLRVSPITSKGALVKPPEKAGYPWPMIDPFKRRTADIHRMVS